MTTTALASQYAENLKNLNEDAEGVSQWERFFLQPLQQSYQTAQGQVEQQAGYDISQAYANYKQSQLNLLQNQQLTSGFKEQVASSLQSNYENTYNQVRATELSNLVALQEEYNTDLAEENERLLGIGENLARLEEDIWGYIGTSDALASGYYTMEDGNMVLTDLGRDVIQRVLYGTDNWTTTTDKGETKTKTGWAETLREVDPDLYDWYSQNRGLVNTVVGGLDANTMDWTTEDETRYQNRLTEQAYQKRLEVTPELQKGTAEIGVEGINTKARVIKYDGKEYYAYGQGKDSAFVIRPNSVEAKVGDRKSWVNITEMKSYQKQFPDYFTINKDLNIVDKVQKGSLQIGDVIEYNGNLYAIANKDATGVELQPLTEKNRIK